MKTTTAIFKQILSSKGARTYVIKVDLDLANNTTLHLTGEDIWEDSFSIDTASSGTSSFDIGSAIIGKCTFTLNNIDGDFDNVDFFNAEATVWLGLEGDITSATQNYYRMGFFTVDEPQKANGLISLTLLDNMWKFDVPLSDVGTIFTQQSTSRSIVNAICSYCGVTLATQSFHGYDFPLTTAPDNVDEMNCREMLQYIAMIGCNFCHMDDQGNLRIEWYNTSYTSSTTVVCDLNQSTSFGTEDIEITGVKFVIDKTEYTTGTNGYRLELENPLVNENNVSSVLSSIWGVLSGFTLRTFNITTASDLSAEIGDRIKIKDYQGNYVYSWITTNSFKLAGHLIQCNAQAPNRTLVKRYTKDVKASVEIARQQSIELISNYDLSVQQLNKLVEQSMGAFEEYEDSQNGGKIFYLSNMPITKDPDTGVCSFESGSTVFRMAGDVFSVSIDGGQTWQNGYNPQTGELIVNVLSAIGIQAEWVKTGTLTVGGSTSGTQHPTIEVYDASNNLICEINRFGITMHQGIISSPDYAEVSGATYSTTGMKLDVLQKILRSPYFAIDTNGAYFRGTIRITGEAEIGSGSTIRFYPAEYSISDTFDLKVSPPANHTGDIYFRLLKYNSSEGQGNVEYDGHSTDDEPVIIHGLSPLITGVYDHYALLVTTSGVSVTASIEEYTLAYVGQEGFKGNLEGTLNGTIHSQYGDINGLLYGKDHDGKKMLHGSLELPPEYSSLARVLDFPNAEFYIGNSDGTNKKAVIGLADEGTVYLFGYGNSGRVVGFSSHGNCDMYIEESNYGGTLKREYENPQQPGTYIEQEVVWDDGNFMKYSEVQVSTTDSPPQTLANGHLFLVYET